MVCVKTIKVNSGWQGSGLWSQCYQHTVKLTVASSLTHCTAFSPDSCWWLKPAVCTLCRHYCPSLIKTVIFPWLSRFLHWKFIHFVRCLHWADKMSGKQISLSLSLSLSFIHSFSFGHETGLTKTQQLKPLMSKQSLRSVSLWYQQRLRHHIPLVLLVLLLLPAVQVCHSQLYRLQSNKKLKRD